MKKVIFFDLDGTLLPMDMDTFVRTYFGLLAARLAPLGYDPGRLPGTLWKGVMAMTQNDGSMTNEQRFWEVFTEAFGDRYREDLPVFDSFYRTEFHRAKSVCGENPLAKKIVAAARARAERVVLATNPLFPPVAVESRLSWIGLKPADFDLVTTYDTDRYCKPNPAYFQDLLRRLGVPAAECVMIGNDEYEDMWAAAQAGIEGYLVTDGLIPSEKHPYAGPRGTSEQLLAWLETL